MSSEKRRGQARLRLVVDNESSKGYKSGRKRWRGTPDTASMGSTRSAGTRPDASQPETLPCDLSPRHRAKALCPPTALQASRNASADMVLINAQTVNCVNAESGSAPSDNRGVSKKPTLRPSPFWMRLEEALKDNPSWQPLNANSVAMKLRMSQGSVHRWFTGAGLPELETAKYLAAQGGVCVDWLLNAVKPKYPLSRNPRVRALFDMIENFDDDAITSVIEHAEGVELRRQKAMQEVTKKKA